ncbi:MAG: hypothetical protein AUK47_04015 [Deltaproteobacteria bacterium CG2_30_63_29]|nr:MAG: hypothetical protein AUK47_04015 [Deltaproteobacteria bacterium CG2_30_63_29]
MKRIQVGLVALAVVSMLVLPSCKSNSEKIAQFCSDWKTIAEENKNDCAALGKAMKEMITEYDDVKLYGSTDDEGSQKAAESCQEAATFVMTCIDNKEVMEAMEMLEPKN